MTSAVPEKIKPTGAMEKEGSDFLAGGITFLTLR
jgi:hypothetical protein